jgi:hypothetical protein
MAARATPEDERECGEEMAGRGRAMFWRFDPEPNVTRQADSYPGMPLTERTLKRQTTIGNLPSTLNYQPVLEPNGLHESRGGL